MYSLAFLAGYLIVMVAYGLNAPICVNEMSPLNSRNYSLNMIFSLQNMYMYLSPHRLPDPSWLCLMVRERQLEVPSFRQSSRLRFAQTLSSLCTPICGKTSGNLMLFPPKQATRRALSHGEQGELSPVFHVWEAEEHTALDRLPLAMYPLWVESVRLFSCLLGGTPIFFCFIQRVQCMLRMLQKVLV